jgi:glutamate/tyrosine decarboxylase-like PLP-dependent enzyme
MLCARNRAFPESKSSGFAGSERPTAFISDHAHYSYLTAANQLGIGIQNVVRVGTDDLGRMIPDELEREISRSIEAGRTPFFIGATSGTTVFGAFDSLRDLALIASKFGLWLHSDGAWGGPLLLSRKHRHLLDGIELTDSFTWDAHKLMGATLICTAFLTRHVGILQEACSVETASDTEYLFHENEDAGFNLGKKSLQCGRRIDSLKLWMMWKHYGDEGLEARIDRLFELARHAARTVEKQPEFELLAPVQSLNICFRCLPHGDLEVNSYNLELRERLRRSGKGMVNYSTVNGNVAFRLVFANPEMNESDLHTLFDNILQFGRELENG